MYSAAVFTSKSKPLPEIFVNDESQRDHTYCRSVPSQTTSRPARGKQDRRPVYTRRQRVSDALQTVRDRARDSGTPLPCRTNEGLYSVCDDSPCNLDIHTRCVTSTPPNATGFLLREHSYCSSGCDKNQSTCPFWFLGGCSELPLQRFWINVNNQLLPPTCAIHCCLHQICVDNV